MWSVRQSVLDLQTLPRLFNLRDVPAPEVTVTEALERARLEKADRSPPGAGAPEGRRASRGRRGTDAGRGVAKPAREHARGPSADGSAAAVASPP